MKTLQVLKDMLDELDQENILPRHIGFVVLQNRCNKLGISTSDVKIELRELLDSGKIGLVKLLNDVALYIK